jgi:hypothetical protein
LKRKVEIDRYFLRLTYAEITQKGRKAKLKIVFCLSKSQIRYYIPSELAEILTLSKSSFIVEYLGLFS